MCRLAFEDIYASHDVLQGLLDDENAITQLPGRSFLPTWAAAYFALETNVPVKGTELSPAQQIVVRVANDGEVIGRYEINDILKDRLAMLTQLLDKLVGASSEQPQPYHLARARAILEQDLPYQ